MFVVISVYLGEGGSSKVPAFECDNRDSANTYIREVNRKGYGTILYKVVD